MLALELLQYRARLGARLRRPRRRRGLGHTNILAAARDEDHVSHGSHGQHGFRTAARSAVFACRASRGGRGREIGITSALLRLKHSGSDLTTPPTTGRRPAPREHVSDAASPFGAVAAATPLGFPCTALAPVC
jgi:hypothetical protein